MDSNPIFKELVYDILPEEMGKLVDLSIQSQSFMTCMGFAHGEEEREIWRTKWQDSTLAFSRVCEEVWIRYRKPYEFDRIAPFPPPVPMLSLLTNQFVVRYCEKGVKTGEVEKEGI